MRPQFKTGLAVIGVLIALWFLWTRLAGSGAPAAASSTGAAAEARTQAKAKGKGLTRPEDVPDVVGNLAHQRPGEVFLRERSLFDFAMSPEKVAADEEKRRLAAEEAAAAAEKARAEAEERERLRREQMAADAERQAKEQRAAQEAAARLPKPLPPPPSFPHQFIGTIGPTDSPFAILYGVADKKYRYARAGDVVDDKFRIEHVGWVRLDISYTDPQFAGRFANIDRTRDSISDAQPRR